MTSILTVSPPGEFLRSACMGLVVHDERGIYSLFHLTAYEFFRGSPEVNATTAHLLISKTCMTYLSFFTIRREGPCKSLAALEARNSQLAFLDYAAKNWAEHAKCVEEHILDDIDALLGDDILRSSLVQSFYYRQRHDEELQRLTFRSLPIGLSPLQLSCGRGLIHSVGRQLLDGADVRGSDDQGWTPLVAAASYGHLEVVKLLLHHVKSTEKCTDGSASAADPVTNTSWSAKGSRQLLNKDRAAIDQCDHEGWSPLFWSIIKSHHDVTAHLLASGAEAALRDSGGWTPLDWAACRADSSLVQLVLQYASQQPEKEHRSSAKTVRGSHKHGLRQFSSIHLAASAGDLQSVRALIEFGTNNKDYGEKAFGKLLQVLSKTEIMSTMEAETSLSVPSLIFSEDFTVKLFESAIRCDQFVIVKMLVELGAPLGPMACEESNRSPLHIAAFCDRRAICEYLIERGACTTLEDRDRNTPLDLALCNGSIACVGLLLPAGYASSTLVREGTALRIFVSAWYGDFRYPYADIFALESKLSEKSASSLDERLQKPYLKSSEFTPRTNVPDTDDTAFDIVQILLGLGYDLATNVSSFHGHTTVLHLACRGMNLAMVNLLLAQGCDVNAIDSSGRTALHAACKASYASPDILRTLLEHGAKINALDKLGRSPLMEACGNLSIDNIRLLVSHGADVNLRDKLDRHPLHAVCERSYDPEDANASSDIIDLVLDHSEEGVLSSECKVPSYQSNQCPEASPFGIAMWAGNGEAMEALRRHGANPPEARNDESSSLEERLGTAEQEFPHHTVSWC